MCGILGQIESDRPVDPKRFARMLETLTARGPDSSGVELLEGGRVALGHRRLSIIDLSSAGTQPMTNEDGSVWLTYNGEIYNYRELREELQCAGHSFRSQTDSEVLIHGYEEWGDAVVERLRGIFAFGIWDGRRQRLLLARDHIGVKPLYYTTDPARFSFASQPRAIVEDERFERRLDLGSLRDYLGYGTVPYDRAIFQGMAKLPAAHLLVLEGGRIDLRPYWELSCEESIADPEDAARELREKLEECVRAQMVSDVPIGLFLSGGIDSSTIAAVACAHSGTPLETFTVGFEQARKDERVYARRASELLGTRHHERVLDFPTATGLLGELVEVYDEPFYLNSAFPTYHVSKMVQSAGLKVILSGDGGDELFAGYTRYDDFHRKLTMGLPSYAAEVARRAFSGLRPAHLRADPMADYFEHEGRLAWPQQARLFSEGARREIEPDVLWRLRRFYRPELPPVTAARVVDLHTFLMDEVLCKVDRASMACGVEVRVPLLDPELVELAFRIDSEVVYAAGQRKAVLKRAVADLLPPDVLSGRKKGFSVPLNAWLKQGLQAWARPLCTEGTLVERGVFDREAVAALIDGSAPKFTWLLAVAELWARRWLDDRSDWAPALP